MQLESFRRGVLDGLLQRSQALLKLRLRILLVSVASGSGPRGGCGQLAVENHSGQIVCGFLQRRRVDFLQCYLLQRRDHPPDDRLFLRTAVAAAGRQDDRQHIQHQRQETAAVLLLLPGLALALVKLWQRCNCSWMVGRQLLDERRWRRRGGEPVAVPVAATLRFLGDPLCTRGGSSMERKRCGEYGTATSRNASSSCSIESPVRSKN